MFNQLAFILFFLLLHNHIYAQNFFFIGEKSYKSTPSFTFKANSSSGEDLEILIAKKESGFLIALTANVPGDDETCKHNIKGDIIIYLEDGKVITCSDRSIYIMLMKKQHRYTI